MVKTRVAPKVMRVEAVHAAPLTISQETENAAFRLAPRGKATAQAGRHRPRSTALTC